MRRAGVALLLCLLCATATAFAQFQSGNIFGSVVDEQRAAIPGTTITLSGIGAPHVFVSDEKGLFRFLALSPGHYSLEARLEGFATVRRDVEVNVANNSEVLITLQPAITETITVNAETPLLDVRKTGTGATTTRAELEQVPTPRDPWTVMQSTPGVLVNRLNVGGSASGSQAGVVSKGVTSDQTTYNMDGVNITDDGSSPMYYDFDSFEELQITTGGTDPRIQTAGLQLNMVTKRGTNQLRGSGRWFWTDDHLQARAFIPEEARSYLTQPSRIDRLDDHGVEVGGPLIKDRLWLWGAWSRSQINLEAAGQPSINKATLNDSNAKLNVQISASNSGVVLNTRSEKIVFGREVGVLRPPETGWNQSGPAPFYKIEDTQIFSQNTYVTAIHGWSNRSYKLIPVGGLDKDVWIDETGVSHNSFFQFKTHRPQSDYRVDGSRFFRTGVADHELKFGFNYRSTPFESSIAWPGSGNLGDFSEGGDFALAWLTRPGHPSFETNYRSFYAGDTLSWKKFVLQAGFRYDVQQGRNRASSVPANPVIPDLIPAASFNGDVRELQWKSVSPRIGVTYTLGESRRTMIRAAYSRYADQLGTGNIVLANPFNWYQTLFFYWEDTNHDRRVQRNEILFDLGLQGFYGLDPANPSSPVTPYRLDYRQHVPTTDEFIVGVERELTPAFTIGLNVTHRRRTNFIWTQFEKTPGAGDYYTSADYDFQGRATGTLPDGTPYSVPFYRLRPETAVPTYAVVTNRPDYSQMYNGAELVVTKRLTDRWMVRGNVSLNDWKQHVGQRGFIDPTELLDQNGCSRCDGATVVQNTGQGVYINSRWSYNVAALWQWPWRISVGANVHGQEGFPLPYFRQLNLGDGTGSKSVLLAGVDSTRMNDIFELDLRLARELRIAGRFGVIVSADLFNTTNETTVTRRQNNLTRGNRILDLESPRVLRLGARVAF